MKLKYPPLESDLIAEIRMIESQVSHAQLWELSEAVEYLESTFGASRESATAAVEKARKEAEPA